MQEQTKIRVLIVDDVPETCENVRCLLNFETRIEVIRRHAMVKKL